MKKTILKIFSLDKLIRSIDKLEEKDKIENKG